MPDLADYRAELAAALDYAGGTYIVDDVLDRVAKGDAQAWYGPRSVVITEIIEHPRKRVLHFFLAAGIMAEIEVMAPLILAWGKERGCTGATLIGRKGWQRSFLARTGWKQSDCILMETTL